MKKILLTGGSGFIGRNVIDFYKDSKEYAVTAPSSKELDCTNHEAVHEFLKKGHFDYVLNFAVPKNDQTMLDNGLRMDVTWLKYKVMNER